MLFVYYVDAVTQNSQSILLTPSCLTVLSGTFVNFTCVAPISCVNRDYFWQTNNLKFPPKDQIKDSNSTVSFTAIAEQNIVAVIFNCSCSLTEVINGQPVVRVYRSESASLRILPSKCKSFLQ